MSRAPDERNERPATAGRPWGVAMLVWVAVSCVLAPVLFAEFQFFGLGHFRTPKGELELLGFLRTGLVYPGLVLPALIVLAPRWSAVVCGLLFAGCLALLAFTAFQSTPLVHAFAFWGSRVLPAVLVGIAGFLAYRRRDGLAVR